jgi:acylphosphatase
MAESEVAQFRYQQALQEEAAQRGLNGFAIVARHESITARMEIGAQRLLKLIEEGKHEEAQAIMNTAGWELETLEDLPDMPTRSTLVDLLRCELDHTEEVATLIEHIQQMWKTIDMLRARFGIEPARKIMETPSSLGSEKEEIPHE